MMNKNESVTNYRFTKAVMRLCITFVLCIGLAFCFMVVNNATIKSIQAEESAAKVNAGWKDWQNSQVSANADGSVTLGSAGYNTVNLYNDEYFKATGKMVVEVDLTIDKKPADSTKDHFFGVFLSGKPISAVEELYTVGTAGSALKGALCPTYPCDPRYIAEGNMGAIATDDAYRAATQFPVDYSGHQKIRFEISETSYDMYVNGTGIYTFTDSATGASANINNLKDEEGNVQAYLGILNTVSPGEENYLLTVHSVDTGKVAVKTDWKDWQNSDVYANDNGSVTLASTGYYQNNLLKDYTSGKAVIEVDLTIDRKPTVSANDHFFGVFLSGKPISAVEELYTAGTAGSAFKGAFYPTDPCDPRYIVAGNMGVIPADTQWIGTSATQIPVDYAGHQKIRFEISETSYDMYVNGMKIYTFTDSATGEPANINNLKDEEGNVQAYLGILNTVTPGEENYLLTVHGVNAAIDEEPGVLSGWKNYQNGEVYANEDSSATLDSISYYDHNLFDQEYYQNTGRVSVEVEFGVDYKPADAAKDHYFGFHLNSTPISNVDEQVRKLATGEATSKGAFFPTYPCDPRYIGENNIGIIGVDHTYPYQMQMPFNYGERNVLRFEVTDNFYGLYLNGHKVARYKTLDGKFAGIESLKDAEGNINAYLYFTNSTFGEEPYKITVYSIKTSDVAAIEQSELPKDNWESYFGYAIEANTDNTVNVIGQSFNTTNLFNEEFYQQYNKAIIKVNFNVLVKPETPSLDNRFGFLLKSKPLVMGQDMDENLASPGSLSKGAFFFTYPTREDYNVQEGQISVEGFDYSYRGFNVYDFDYSASHEIKFVITAKAYSIYLDGIKVASLNDETTGMAANLQSLKDADGKFNAYLGITNTGGNYEIRINSIVNNENDELANWEEVGETEKWVGIKDKVSVNADNELVLSNGTAYTKDYISVGNGIQGTFEVTSVAGYNPRNNGLTAYLKDDYEYDDIGNGFKFNLKPINEKGIVRTRLVVGYIHNNNYKELLVSATSINTVGKHYYALLKKENGYKLVIDGYSVDFNSDDMTVVKMLNDINWEKLSFVINADNVNSATAQAEGDFTVKLAYPKQLKANESYSYAGSSNVTVSGEYVAEKTEIDGRNYEIVKQNKVYTVEELSSLYSSQTVIFDNQPIRVFPKLQRQLEIKLNALTIPAYAGENDAYIQLFFSGVQCGTTNLDDVNQFILTLRWKDENTVLATCRIGETEKDVELAAVKGQELTILLGWDQNESGAGDAVIAINGKRLHEGKLPKANFLMANGEMGYFTLRTFNNSLSEENWKFTVSAPVHTDVEMPKTETGEDNKDSEIVDIGCSGCSNQIGAQYLILPLALCAAAAVLKRKAFVK